MRYDLKIVFSHTFSMEEEKISRSGTIPLKVHGKIANFRIISDDLYLLSFLGLRELCFKSSLFYSEFPQKLYHYVHYYSQNPLIILNILNFTAILFSFSSLLQSKCATILCSGLYYIKCTCNSLLQ